MNCQVTVVSRKNAAQYGAGALRSLEWMLFRIQRIPAVSTIIVPQVFVPCRTISSCWVEISKLVHSSNTRCCHQGELGDSTDFSSLFLKRGTRFTAFFHSEAVSPMGGRSNTVYWHLFEGICDLVDLTTRKFVGVQIFHNASTRHPRSNILYKKI